MTIKREETVNYSGSTTLIFSLLISCKLILSATQRTDKYLTENGDLERAMSNSEKLCQLCKESPKYFKAYSEVHKVVKLLSNLNSLVL